MIRKKITTDDFVTSKYTHKRFGEEVECRPISTYFKAGLLKDYKNLNTDAEVLFFDGLKTPGDAGQGIYRKVYINAVEDIGVYIKINNHLYKRQFTGAVNLGWFGDDSAAIRTALKYGFIRFERKHYELEYDAYSLTNNVKIDLNGATITIKDTPLYGFFFRVNDYILKIFNGTIKAHKGITNIARFNNASAITTDFRTNIEFLDLEGNELEEHQIPQTNEILYRGKRLVINGRKHFNGNNRTLRVKSGLAAPTEKNQLVPASYEVPEFDYSNIWKSNVDTTIVGIKTFTNFQYTKESISIFQAPATKSALEYYLQVYKSSIESQLVNKFIIGTYFKLNAYYISCEVYKEEVNPDTPDAAPTLVVDDTYTPNVNALFNQTRFTQFKSRSVQSVFEWGVGDYKKYKWVINKRIYSKDKYNFTTYAYVDFDFKNTYDYVNNLLNKFDTTYVQLLIITSNIPIIDFMNFKMVITLENTRYIKGFPNITHTTHSLTNNNIKYIIENGYLHFLLYREYDNGRGPSIVTNVVITLDKTYNVFNTKTAKYIPYNGILTQDLQKTFTPPSNVMYGISYNYYNKFYSMELINKSNEIKYLRESDNYASLLKLIVYNLALRLKTNIFSKIVYEHKTQTEYYSNDSTDDYLNIEGTFPLDILGLGIGIIKQYNIKTYTIKGRYAYAGYKYNNSMCAFSKPTKIFIGNLSTGEASLEEDFDESLNYDYKHKFISYTLGDCIGRAFQYNVNSIEISNRAEWSRYHNRWVAKHVAASLIPHLTLNYGEILKYFDIAVLPEGKTKEDFTYEELEKMIINPT